MDEPVGAALNRDISKGERAEADLDRFIALRHDQRHLAQAAIRRLKQDVIARDGHVCGVCGDEVAVGNVSIDHVIPVSRGGSNEMDNLQVAHRSYNSRKGATYGDEVYGLRAS